jgi:glycine C-acetyltransferase
LYPNLNFETVDIFKKLDVKKTPLGKYRDVAEGYFAFPKLEGEIGPRMTFRGKEVLVWSINNYLGLANMPEIRQVDAQAAKDWGLAYPMGARLMSGHTSYHEKLEQELAAIEQKEDAFLLNYGYQGMVSIIDSLLDRHDVVIYDNENHACIYDGTRLHFGKRLVYQHNDMAQLEDRLQKATKMIEGTPGGILVITEGVYGMSGDLGDLRSIAALKKKYEFRLLIDDAHGFGSMGEQGRGTADFLGVQDEIDVYFGTFAKAMAGIGGFVAGPKHIIDYFRYSMRSQIFAKALPMPMVIGALKRLEYVRSGEQRKKLWVIVNALQEGLRKAGFDLGHSGSPVTPVIFHGEPAQATNIILDLRENYGIFSSAVVYPVVPKGIILIRLIPTAAHSLEDVAYTVNAFDEVAVKLKQGKYDGTEVKMV